MSAIKSCTEYVCLGIDCGEQDELPLSDENLNAILFPKMTAQGTANTYVPSPEQTPGKTFRRYGIRIGFSAANDLLKEYWPTVLKSLRIRKAASGVGPEPADCSASGPPKPR